MSSFLDVKLKSRKSRRSAIRIKLSPRDEFIYQLLTHTCSQQPRQRHIFFMSTKAIEKVELAIEASTVLTASLEFRIKSLRWVF